jgi:hypothetical protein
MAFDEALFARVWTRMTDRPEADYKKMFGGVCFLTKGNMACGILGEELIVRVGPEGSRPVPDPS